jgi:hypothetical protein
VVVTERGTSRRPTRGDAFAQPSGLPGEGAHEQRQTGRRGRHVLVGTPVPLLSVEVGAQGERDGCSADSLHVAHEDKQHHITRMLDKLLHHASPLAHIRDMPR